MKKNTISAEDLESLKLDLPVGSTMYLVERRHSQNSTDFSVIVIKDNKPYGITWKICELLSSRLQDNGGIRISGTGFNRAFELCYRIGRKLYPDGFYPKDAGKEYGRNGSSADDLDRDGGYALNYVYL